MYLDALYEMVPIGRIFQFKRSDLVVDANHDEVVSFGVDVLDCEVSDVLKVKEKPPLEELALLTGQQSAVLGFCLGETMGDSRYLPLKLNKLCL